MYFNQNRRQKYFLKGVGIYRGLPPHIYFQISILPSQIMKNIIYFDYLKLFLIYKLKISFKNQINYTFSKFRKFRIFITLAINKYVFNIILFHFFCNLLKKRQVTTSKFEALIKASYQIYTFINYYFYPFATFKYIL